MYVSAICYVVILATLMLLGLWQEQKYGGGNHWAYFGTPLDLLIQTIGLAGVLALSLPPGAVAVLARVRGHIRWSIVLVTAALTLAAISFFFGIMALD